ANDNNAQGYALAA
ncbi:tmRNA tag peptide, partial [Brucella abortus str. 2308 A]